MPESYMRHLRVKSKEYVTAFRKALLGFGGTLFCSFFVTGVYKFRRIKAGHFAKNTEKNICFSKTILRKMIKNY